MFVLCVCVCVCALLSVSLSLTLRPGGHADRQGFASDLFDPSTQNTSGGFAAEKPGSALVSQAGGGREGMQRERSQMESCGG